LSSFSLSLFLIPIPNKSIPKKKKKERTNSENIRESFELKMQKVREEIKSSTNTFEAELREKNNLINNLRKEAHQSETLLKSTIQEFTDYKNKAAHALQVEISSLLSILSIIIDFSFLFFSFLFFSFLSFPFLSFPFLSFPFLSFSFLSCPFLSLNRLKKRSYLILKAEKNKAARNKL